MPTFYFHIRQRDNMVNDEEGVDLPNLTAAREEARQALREMVAAHISAGEEVRTVAIEICDGHRNDLATVSLASAISATFPVSEDTLEVDLKKYLDSGYNPCD
jgi:uncharacterized protein YoaH (UPF0181 family)